ncbi:hypothetical protein CPB84DRAFT_1759339 [Gymnopilus junonius]|uniref:GRIP domain-containing protein n=1 Tax=Gymnopilus junonius TaxID=109634 RepID=A0A9P5P0G1_GYMJU|nr:hypothetical protein CPB84DRAFT_1759339 [Gymnopilus junonius]
MFSQLRSAVEQLAQQPIRVLDGSSSETQPTEQRSSLDMSATRNTSPLSSGQLAESAISSLRKSLAAQRSSSTSSSQSSKSPAASPPPPDAHPSPRKSNLEERLRRATHVIADSSASSTTQRSSRVASPSPIGRKPSVSSITEPSPARRAESPARRAESPARRAESPVRRVDSTARRAESPVRRSESPAPTRRAESPARRAESPVRRVESSLRRAESPVRRASSPLVKSVTPPEKKLVQAPKKPSVIGSKAQEVDSKSTIESLPMTEPAAVEFESIEDPMEDESKGPETATTSESVKDTLQEDMTGLESKNTPSVDSSSSEEASIVEVAPDVEPTSEEHEQEVEPSKESPVVEETAPFENAPETKPAPQEELREAVKPTDFEEVPVVEAAPFQEAEVAGTVSQLPEPKEPKVISSEEHVTSQPSEIQESSELPSSDPVPPPEDIQTSQPTEPVQETKLQPKEDEPASPPTTLPVVDHSAEVESLQARLKQVEQRFSDVSTSFKRLQAEKQAADAVLRDTTPVESIKDANALREYFAQLKTKDEVFQEEIKRLNQKLELQDDRLEEIRDTHKLESHSLSEEVRKLRTQLNETEALFEAAQRATSKAEEAVSKQKEEYTQLHKEVETAKNIAREEEEKRVKAISLLKTVRQKLVKAEKEKDDALREVASIREREKDEKSKEQAERLNFQREIESLNTTHEKEVATLKAQFNKDMASTKDRYEQEIAALRGQFELDLATVKSTHTKELGAKTSQITTLENSLNSISRDKNAFFDQLQLRQAELESSQSHLESLQHQNTEIQFQLREANDRLALLKEEYSELLREQESRSRDPVVSADEIARMVSATEAKYEAKLAEVKRNVSILEKERYEAEADWSRKLKEKVKELDDLKRVLGSATRTREAEENAVAGLKSDLAQAQELAKNLERQVSELPLLREQIDELQTSVKILVLEKQIEETKAREMQLKQSNKTLREELRKVQSSAALLERQRNPGVGYWTSRVTETSSPAEPRASISSVDSPSRTSSPAPGSSSSAKNEEEVNLEYLRNVILQFLEHKEMRPSLVKVLSVILHFTPQETRRLIAKV